jgi:hypothetical protein
MGGHLDGGAHPGKLAGFGDDGVIGVERKLKDGHGGSGDAMLHGKLLVFLGNKPARLILAASGSGQKKKATPKDGLCE